MLSQEKCKTMVRKSLIILPWILLGLLSFYTIFSPNRGYIGPIEYLPMIVSFPMKEYSGGTGPVISMQRMRMVKFESLALRSAFLLLIISAL